MIVGCVWCCWWGMVVWFCCLFGVSVSWLVVWLLVWCGFYLVTSSSPSLASSSIFPVLIRTMWGVYRLVEWVWVTGVGVGVGVGVEVCVGFGVGNSCGLV